jgi:hypothetical protein
MIRRLNSNIAYALIASAVGLSGYGVGNAADNPTAPDGASKAATMPGTATPPPAPPSNPGSASTPAAGATTDSTMAPRGTNPSAATNATAGAADSPAKRIFDQLDTNHDGSLSLEEFSRATFQQPAKQ